MHTLFDACTPRRDVLEGTLTESMFAAKLSDVVNGVAADVYKIPADFFASTYPTEGMRSLIEESCGRLTGQGRGASAIRLDTSFGGGKTHQLIGLYHIARHSRSIPGIERFADPSVLPTAPVRVAAVVGSDLDPVNGVYHEQEGIRTYTLWGEIAYRLGTYDLIAESDQQRVAPGTQRLSEMIGDQPTLIIVDEIATYLARLVGRSQAEQGQLTAFLFSLLELGTIRPQFSLVYTLATSNDALGYLTDDLRRVFEQRQVELSSVSARQETIITATLDQEVAGIVTYRLFASVNRDTANEVALAYADLYRRNLDGGEPLPSMAGSGDYRQALERSYPLHPETLNVLINKVGTLANFQRTRGALRLLALVIRDLWQTRPADATLVHLHHINLGNDEIAAELTSRLDRPGMRGPIQADIVSTGGNLSHAQELDAGPVASGKPPIHRYAATSVFMHSLVVGTTAGATINDVTLASSGPSIQPSMLVTALEGLESVAWHLDLTATGQYRFRTEPSLNKVVADRKGDISTSAVKQEIRQRLLDVYNSQQFRMIPSPSVPSEIDDTMTNVALAVIDFDSATVDGANKVAPALVQRLWERTGTDESFRRYVNRVFFLLAESGQLDRLFDRTREMLAVEQATQDADLLNSLETVQRQRLDERKGGSKLDFRVALCNTYWHLYYPGEGGLRQVTLPPQDTAGAKRSQQQVLYDTLKGLRQIQEASQPLSPEWVRAKVWPGAQDKVGVKALYEQFYAKAGLPLLQTPTVLVDCIVAGLRTDAWRAKQGDIIISKLRANIPTTVDLAGDIVLYDPSALDDSVPTVMPTPTGTSHGQETPAPYTTGGTGASRGSTTSVAPPVPASTVTGMGDVNRAFAEMRDECEREHISSIKRLALEVEGKDAVRALGLALPGLPRRGVTIQQKMQAYIGASDYLTLDYSLPLDKTNSLRSALRAFDENMDTASMTVQVAFEPAVPSTDSSIATIQTALGTHAIVITVHAERAE